ncbi:MAG: hypothetical protein GF307_08615, partial [candidate division Zixibacteria bacterium]|nr:hypothetical protein [candidate division Zixibacteria bacterium]
FTLDCACKSQIRGSGNVVTRDVNISGVDGVHLGTIGTLHVKLGGEEKFVVEAEDNIQEYIKVRVRGGVLTITLESDGGINTTEDIHYYLTVKELKSVKLSSAGDGYIEDDIKTDDFEISISSAGDLEMQKIEANEVDISVSSAGDVEIEDVRARELDVRISSAGDVSIHDGEVERQDVRISSAGDYNAKSVSSKEAKVMVSSSGDAVVMVEERLDASSSSSGSILYIGDPVVHSRTSSSGDVRRIRSSL